MKKSPKQAMRMNSPTIPIETDDVRKRMDEIIKCVNRRSDEFMIKRKNNPLAMLMPVQKHLAFKQLTQKFLLKRLQTKGRDISQQ